MFFRLFSLYRKDLKRKISHTLFVACTVFYDIEKESRVDSLSVNLTLEVPGGFEPNHGTYAVRM